MQKTLIIIALLTVVILILFAACNPPVHAETPTPISEPTSGPSQIGGILIMAFVPIACLILAIVIGKCGGTR